MRKTIILGLLFVVIVISGCGNEREHEKSYKNSDFGFSINYPSGYQAKEIKWARGAVGVELLKNGKGVLSLQAMPTGTNYAGMPFKNYIKIAASVEIQNYTKLLSIETIVSDYDITGYKTYWLVIEHEDTDRGEINSTYEAGPIYYFPLLGRHKLGSQPVNAIVLSLAPAAGKEKAVENDADEIARSFRYQNRFKALFHLAHRGKTFFVAQNKAFRIELPANPTTGFNWYPINLDENYFKIKSSGYNPSDNKLLGAPGVSYWELIPLKEGSTSIQLLYFRPWEGKDKAVDKYNIRVVVRK
jgi:inhibitor of cysteine peptidase